MKLPLFFSGGTALKSLSRVMALRKQPSIHVLTIHDSGGSSQVLRKYFNMPAIGDIRNRILALAAPESETCRNLLAKRVPAHLTFTQAQKCFMDEVLNLQKQNSTVFKEIIADLEAFEQAAGSRFDFRCASLGNLAMTGSYLANERSLTYVIKRYSRMFNINGVIVPSCEEGLHLAAELQNGTVIHGQHRFKEITCRVQRVWFTKSEPWKGDPPVPCYPAVSSSAVKAIQEADIICYPMGSFYSSVLVNLLPAGIGDALAESRAKKVYIPNIGYDPEQSGLNILEQVRILLKAACRSLAQIDPKDVLDAVVIDSKGSYKGGFASELKKSLSGKGIELIDCDMLHENYHDPDKLLNILQAL